MTGAGTARGVAAFVRERREAWERLEALAGRVDGGRLTLGEVEELDRLYRRAAGDLARARAAFPGSDAEGYLAQATARAHAALHRRRRRPAGALLRLLRVEGPAEVAGHPVALALSAGLLAAGVAGGALAQALAPEAAGWLVPAPVREALSAGRLWTDDLLLASPGLAGGAILRNNVAVATLAFSLGLTGGVGTAALLLANGLVLGAVLAASARAGLGEGLLGFVAAHGPVELSALVLAGQAGFLLAAGLVLPGEWPRAVALAARARQAARVVAVVVPALLLAALIEATVSPAGRFPTPARAGLGLAVAAALWAYLLRAGRGAAASVASAVREGA